MLRQAKAKSHQVLLASAITILWALTTRYITTNFIYPSHGNRVDDFSSLDSEMGYYLTYQAT